ncbi:MAG: c-type cytochrome [Magnetospiraceae bacterium]
MNWNACIGLLAVTVIGVSAPNAAPAAEASGEMLSLTCNACHGPGGSSHGPATPSIAGMNAFNMEEALKAYKADTRPATVMNRIAKGYTDTEIAAIAKYFAAQELMRTPQMTDATMAEKGQALTRELCSDCHEKDGYDGRDYPVLAGQMMPYLNNALSDFKTGFRDLEKNPNLSAKERRKKMRNLQTLFEDHGEEGVAAVVNFYGSLK